MAVVRESKEDSVCLLNFLACSTIACFRNRQTLGPVVVSYYIRSLCPVKLLLNLLFLCLFVLVVLSSIVLFRNAR